MAKKKKKDDRGTPQASAPRRERIPAPAQGVETARPNRGTFAVKRAQNVLAQALPDLVTVKTRKGRDPLLPAKPRVQTPPISVSATSRDSKPRKPSGSLPQPNKPLSLDPLPSTCKARPTSTTGDGSSRAFVPWCDKR